MIEIGNAIVSREVVQKRFACKLSLCKGICCVEGVAGAPLEDGEKDILKEILHHVLPFMSRAGRNAVAEQGVFVIDADGEEVTPLVEGRECAYAIFKGDGSTSCALELAHNAGQTSFLKPLSCHLYPVRITRYQHFDAVNYHDWDICHQSCAQGNAVPVYRFVQNALIRKYGQEWYAKLENAAAAFL